MTGEIVNLVFLGTGEHRDSTKSALTQLYNHISDDQKPFTRLFDGPGSKPGENSKDPIPGQYSYNPQTGEKEPYHTDPRAQQFYALCQKISGNLAGDGIEDNMMEATLWLAKAIEKNNGILPEKINLYGFSRGADTAIRISNLLAAVYPGIKLNIFAFDPVPGPGRREHYEAKIIPAEVEEIYCIYPMDENRPGFEPQDPSVLLLESPETTQSRSQFYRGVHADPTKLRYTDDARNATGKLGWDDCFSFAERHGTALQGGTRPNYVMVTKDATEKKHLDTSTPSRPLATTERLALYDQMQSSAEFYKEQRSAPILERDFVAKRSLQVRDADFFINQEHRELFKEEYSNVFDWFFQNNVEKLPSDFVIADLQEMQQKHPSMFASLEGKFGIKPIGEQSFAIGKPQGDPIIETRKTDKPLIRDQLSYLQFAINSALNYIHHNPPTALNAEIISDYAEVIREEFIKINKLPENTAAEKDFKSAKLINCVIQNSLALKAAKVESKFLYMLDGIVDTPEAAALRIKAVFDWHLKQNPPVIHDNQIKDLLETTQKVIHAASQSTHLNKLEKQETMQEVLKNCKTTLNKVIPPDDQSREIEKLNKHLDILIKETGHHLQYTDRAIVLLEKYIFKNQIRSAFQQILESFGISTNLGLSQAKQKIASETLQELKTLKQDGHGNDKNAIQNVLKNALDQSTENYKAYSTTKGSLEATFEQCLSEITPLTSAPVTKTEESATEPNSMPHLGE